MVNEIEIAHTKDDGQTGTHTKPDEIPAANKPNDAAVIAYILHLEKLFPPVLEPEFEDGHDVTPFGEFS